MADFGGSKGRIEDRDDEAPCFSEAYQNSARLRCERREKAAAQEANMFMAHACVS